MLKKKRCRADYEVKQTVTANDARKALEEARELAAQLAACIPTVEPAPKHGPSATREQDFTDQQPGTTIDTQLSIQAAGVAAAEATRA